jgi:hypothetical protein
MDASLTYCGNCRIYDIRTHNAEQLGHSDGSCFTLAGTDLYSPLGTNPRNPYPASQRHISTTSTVMEFVTSISYEYLT